MKVSIKELSVQMDIKNSGVEFDVYSPDGSEHHGDLVITRSGLTWCNGRTRPENGIKIKWTDFIKWAQSQA